MSDMRKMVSFRLRKRVMDKVQEHCDRIGQTPTEMAERAVRYYVRELDAGHIHVWPYDKDTRIRWSFRMKKDTVRLLADRAGDQMTMSDFLTHALLSYYDYAKSISL